MPNQNGILDTNDQRIIRQMFGAVREELHERIDTLQHSTAASFDVVLDLHTFLRERVEEIKPLVPDMSVEELNRDFETWNKSRTK